MRGTYLAQGEMTRVIPAASSEIPWTGSGSAAVNLLGTYRGDYPQDYVLEVETGGEVGSATFRWSMIRDRAGKKRAWSADGPDAPVQLEEGLSVSWESGLGPDLVAGDRWTFTAIPPVYHYQVFGASLRSHHFGLSRRGR